MTEDHSTETEADADAAVEAGAICAAVVMADITGSTPLYEREGNDAAAAAINAQLSRMRTVVEAHDGHFVSAKGDDVLCWFADAELALDAAYAMTAMPDTSGLRVHAGAQWGTFVSRDGDIFGNCVNTAARLCDLAKPGEILVGADLAAQLGDDRRATLVQMSPVTLKGKKSKVELYSRLVERKGAARTVMFDLGELRPPVPVVEVRLTFAGREWAIREGQSLSVGRAEENTVSVLAPSVSRQHATVSVSNGLVEFTDHSSAGSFVLLGTGEEMPVFRRAVVLNGAGSIALGGPHDGPDRPCVTFAVGGVSGPD